MDPTSTHPSIPSDTPDVRSVEHARIVRTPGTCGGRPRIDGHRITVEDVAIWHERMGMSLEEITSDYPSLTLPDIHAALAYYDDHREQIDLDIREGERFVEEMRAKAPPSLLQQRIRQGKVHAPDDPLPPR